MATTTAKKPAANTKTITSEMKVGDVFSEVSHYTLKSIDKGISTFTHHESGEDVDLNHKYVDNLLCTAEQFHQDMEVGKEDKLWTEKRIEEWQKAQKTGYDVKDTPKVGDVMVPGIRTIWENIHSSQVFTVFYKKQDEVLSAKKLAELREAQAAEAIAEIEKAAKSKTGIAKAAKEQLEKIQNNPVLPYEEGKMRLLTGYKIQFTSRDGKYQCVDMKLDKSKGTNQRPVNINTIEWLVFNGVKYIVK